MDTFKFPFVDMVLDVVDSEDRLILLVEYICICLCGSKFTACYDCQVRRFACSITKSISNFLSPLIVQWLPVNFRQFDLL